MRYEDVTREDNHALVDLAHVIPGRHLHAAGSDFQAGDELVPAGTRLGSREIAVAATVGATTVPVVAPPRITIVTTIASHGFIELPANQNSFPPGTTAPFQPWH